MPLPRSQVEREAVSGFGTLDFRTYGTIPTCRIDALVAAGPENAGDPATETLDGLKSSMGTRIKGRCYFVR